MFDIISLFAAELEEPKICKVNEYRVLNPFPNKPWFLRVRSTSLLKTL